MPAIPAALAAVLFLGLAVANPAAAAGGSTAGPVPAGSTLQGVVLLSRHGMRGPTKAVHCEGAVGECLDAVAERPWPDLGVAAGHLTLAGYERSVTMGRFYRSLYARAGLLPEAGCPAPERVAFASDSDERTIVTAGAVMDGMFAGCRLAPVAIDAGIYKGPSCGYEPERAAEASRRLAGGSWSALLRGELRRPLAALSEVMGPFQPGACPAFGLPAPCSLEDIRTRPSDPGPLRLASEAAEQFVMQYGGGLPEAEVAWGRLPQATRLALPEAIAFVNALHAASGRFGHMPRYQAVKQGSPVLHLVLQALSAAAEGSGPAFAFFSAHDTLMLKVAGMLGLAWQLEGYPPFQVPPGGAFSFELWRTPQEGMAVRIVYYAQTLDQLRDNTALDADKPPASAVMPVAGCTDGEDGFCPWTGFRDFAAGTIDMACIDPQRQ